MPSGTLLSKKIKNGDSLKRNEFELATTEQKEEYIDWKILMEENLDKYVIEAATDNQQTTISADLLFYF